MNKRKPINLDYLRNLIFGAEDSLVSTVGVLFGLASSAEYTQKQLILAGFVLISVEALSMGAGSYLSEKEVHENDKTNSHRDSPTIGGLIMFISYFLSGCAAMLPYFFFPLNLARFISMTFTFVALFLIGYLPGKKIHSGLRMALIASAAIFIGYVVAYIFEQA